VVSPMVGRPLAARASLATLLVCGGCLPTYVWQDEGDGGGGGGGNGEEVLAIICPSFPQPLVATNGPFGTELLYFGDPEPDPSLNGPLQAHGGAVSPDGLRFIQGWSLQTVLEAPWALAAESWAEPYASSPTFYELHPRLSADNLHLYTCHGGEMKCMLHGRYAANPEAEFVKEYYFQDFMPFNGSASDFAFTPAADGRTLAFASNRVGPYDDTGSAKKLDLWLAHAAPSDDGVPPLHFEHLEKIEAASMVNSHEEPSWLSDEALTLIFYTGEDEGLDIILTERATENDTFGTGIRLPFSEANVGEKDLTLPSIKTLQACGGGYAYYEIVAPQSKRAWMRVPVCIGAPCGA